MSSSEGSDSLAQSSDESPPSPSGEDNDSSSTPPSPSSNSQPPPDKSSSPPPSPPPEKSSPPQSSPPPPDKSSPPPSSPPPPDKSSSSPPSPPSPDKSTPPPSPPSPDKSSPPPSPPSPNKSSPPPSPPSPDKFSPPPSPPSPDKFSPPPSPPSPDKPLPPPSSSSPPSPNNSLPPPPSPPSPNNSLPPPPSPPLPGNSSQPSPLPPPNSSSSSGSTPAPLSQTPPPSDGPSPSPLPNVQHNNSFSERAGVGAGIGLGLIFLIWMTVYIFRSRRKNKTKIHYYGDGKGHKGDHVVRINEKGGWDARSPPSQPKNSDGKYGIASMKSPQPPHSPTSQGTFTFQELSSATDGFDQQNLLGQGGFGYVHKGILPNGKEIAVKSLKTDSGQGEQEFRAEVDIISRVHHRHLVSLVGYCIAGNKRLLVYEFVSNKTLEYHLHGKAMPTMDWSSRLGIAIGSARGLAYLHEDCDPRIIHRDIKASNILLDEHFIPKVSDFGLAKLTNDNNTHVTTRVMGTFGYLAPEYASSGKLTEKSDVYSFGVMLLELITGKQPTSDVNYLHEDGLVDWARPLLNSGLQNGTFRDLVDPFLEGRYNEEEMIRMAHCASTSIRHSSKKRPRMSQIVKVLEGVMSPEVLSSD